MLDSSSPTPLQISEQGLTDLVSIIPPKARLSPASGISPEKLGKIPGKRRPDGTWVGYDWLRQTPTAADLAVWAEWNANIGLLTARFPAVDIDCRDPELAETVEQAVRQILGDAPVRTGLWPKRLMLYTTASPFPRKALNIWRGGERHCVEILGQGRQCVIAGTHPSTMVAYKWDRPLGEIAAASLTPITEAAAESMLEQLAALLTQRGWACDTSHSASRVERAKVPQSELEAPSIDALREAVSLIPNDQSFDDRAAYITMGIAIKAAAGADPASGLEIFQTWADGWECGNDPEVVSRDWDSFKAPFTIGWDYLASLAQQHGFNSAQYEFARVELPPPPADQDIKPLADSDQDLADRFARGHIGFLKHVPLSGKWHHWDGARWVRDELLIARDRMRAFLRGAADKVLRRAPTSKEEAKRLKGLAKTLSSAGMVKHILELASSDGRLTTTPDAFDVDPWQLNTPAGIIDLRTSEVRPHDSKAMLTKMTNTGPDSTVDTSRWDRFLMETTGGDLELIAYLKRLCGYCLTGMTTEQAIIFIYGSGGNGKSVFLNTLLHVLGDYGKQAAMSVFLSTGRHEHPTELATLQGARLVAASETNSRGVWNEARLKSLSGGDRISARYLYGDHFEFTPMLKLLLVGNTKPAFPGVDDAMRRRLHLVSFTRKPAIPDRELSEKLKEEAPGILAWMIEGCRAWQEEGLNPPKSVLEATNQYLDDQDSIGRWLADTCVRGPKLQAMKDELYSSYIAWCNACGETALTWNDLRARLVEKGLTPFQNSKQANRRGLKGIALRPTDEFGMPCDSVSQAPGEAA